MSSTNLLDLSPAEMEELAESLGAPRYRGRQLSGWIFTKDVVDVEAMSDLPRDFRAALAASVRVELPEVERRTPSQDASEKLVLRYADGARVQSVLMPDGDRLTLCVSTQVGCGFGCAFCFTGTMGLERNLSAGEIVGQVMVARRGLGPGDRITHIVYMGMGEPLANYAATVKSLRLLTDPRAFGFSPRRITVSTVGLVSGIERLAKEKLKVNLAISLHAPSNEIRARVMAVHRRLAIGGLAKENLKVNLAISLHATSNEIRDRIMPVNRGFAIEELLAACRRFPLPFRQRMTFEYVLLDGVNDAVEDARRLVRLLRGIRAKI